LGQQYELKYVLEALTQPPLAGCLNVNGGLLSAENRCGPLRGEGLTNREDCPTSKADEHTVKNYLFRIFRQFGVSSRVE